MEFNINEYIMHHVSNSHEWRLPFFAPIALPSCLTAHSVMIILTAFVLIVVFCFVYNRRQAVPTGITNFLEMFVVFIRDEISVACLGRQDGIRMTPLFCTFFFFILSMNLFGLVPLFPTATSNVNVTGALALVSFGFMVLGAIYKNGPIGFIKAFVPHGVPWPVLVLLVPIEIAGMFIKTFALMIRLFANMLAGHIVILSLLSLVVVLGLTALPAVFLALFISLLEVFVALLQAYIFTLLSAMFMGQLYSPSH